MKWPLVFRSRLDAANADRARLRAERTQFAADRDTHRRIAERLTDELAATRIVNTCLTEDLTAARATQSQDADSLQKYIRTLEQQLDHALGMNRTEADNGRHWQETRQDKGTARP
ncbi:MULTISPECIES: hypothetical protein [unclassified Streptomyces]|uniref:hypothetical protein n=1 Tax=unclassified Streptomyces TaxID=2593676 RepID=UPI000DDB196E|nr:MULTISPECIES: hypothetical protein [unclassified Streptomyces]QZZ26574.1 hypothetical protein A7X85_10165 [Streptomyces sp. ST1015]